MSDITMLTGATGYVGGRLLEELERSGVRLRCLTRRPEYLRGRVAESTEIVRGDVLDSGSLAAALQGVSTAYYLVHSMGDEGNFEEIELRAARIFGEEARTAGVSRIIYLGGLGSGSDLSAHLASRQEVGRALRESGVPTIELRASIIIGSGSLSFEMIRALVEKLPVMTTPSWVRVRAQPIAIEDVIGYLLEARTTPLEGTRVVEIGGADVVSYAEIMREYARQRGLRRMMIPVPVLTPALSSLWLGLVTPLYARVGRKLIEGVRNPTVVRDPAAASSFAVRPRGITEAIARALANEDREYASTRWSDAGIGGGGVGRRRRPYGRRMVDSRSLTLEATARAVFAPIRRLGGDAGWYYGDALWRLRGFLDRLAGGPGLRRGRRDPLDLRPGDALDFWRVEAYEPDRMLRLRAEMKLPGRAWLQFEVEPRERGSTLTQTAVFDPRGLAGLLYWYVLLPVHTLMFRGMLRSVARAASSPSA
ncbi:MAG: SDR family oxidoreductase [Candidatus Palauibacterales bacterium]|nr:SDR family oxidoreductase [Candidatus Palauibacterales bacterium]